MSYPAPILNLNFANAKQLVHPALEFSRASQGSYFDGSGILRYVNNSVPRFDHDTLTGICKGLLVEPAVTFLDTYSEQFDNAAWNKYRSTVVANVAIAPDGTLTADNLVETNETLTHVVMATNAQTGTVSSSIFAKAKERRYLYGVIYNPIDGNQAKTCFDLLTGTIVSGSDASSKMEYAGNGFYKCCITASVSAASSFYWHIQDVATIGDRLYTGDGTSGLYIWGAKIYADTGPTSYLPTVASGVTRAADVCSVDLTKLTRNGLPLWTGTEGTIVVDAIVPPFIHTSLYQRLISVDDGTSSNRVTLSRAPNTAKLVFGHNAAGTLVFNVYAASASGNSSSVKVAIALNSAGYAWSINGAIESSASSSNGTMMSSLKIGTGYDNLYQWGGHIRSVQLYNRRIADAYLPALSAM